MNTRGYTNSIQYHYMTIGRGHPRNAGNYTLSMLKNPQNLSRELQEVTSKTKSWRKVHMLNKNVENITVREITFRGVPRDGNRGTYVYGQFFFDNHEGEPTPCISTRIPGGTVITEVLGESVSEGTGKRDSAGREVYEGDTLQDEEGNSYIVEWGEEEAGFYLFQKTSARTFYFPDIKQFWVNNPQDSEKEAPSEE